MRSFHLSWIAFFLCFFSWFGIAPLMGIVRDDLHLTKAQVANTAIASVAATILARLLVGWLCDRFGPRRTYSALMIAGAIPVMGIGLAHSYHSFLFLWLAVGLIGASFVITQYHTSQMFASSVVGVANATSAGWGNLGGGMAQWLMPVAAGTLMALRVDRFLSWRLAMLVPGVGLLATGVLYARLTEDTPDGTRFVSSNGPGAFAEVARDYRVWLLFLLYASCFGMELNLDNVGAPYFQDSFHLSLKYAGLLAGAIGVMNLFARSLGGISGDRAGTLWGLEGRMRLLGILVFTEGIALMAFSRFLTVAPAAATYLLLGLLICMACGATYAVVPFVRPGAIGSVSGIVGAGGNLGAVIAGFVFKADGQSAPHAFLILGAAVTFLSFSALLFRFGEMERVRLLRVRSPTSVAAIPVQETN